MELDNCKHPEGSPEHRRCIQQLWPHVSSYFQGVLVNLCQLEKGAEGGKLAFERFTAADERDRKQLKMETKAIFGGRLENFPGELGEFDQDDDDGSTGSAADMAHVHFSELKAIGCHMWECSKDIRTHLACYFDQDVEFDSQQFKNDIKKLRIDLKGLVDDIHGEFAEYLG